MKFRDYLVATIKSIVVKANYFASRYKEVIWIIGDGRSGTTWLQEMINYDKRYREMFEPFHPILPQMKDFQMFRYIRPDHNEAKFEKVTRNVFSGRITHSRIDYSNRELMYSGLLVKDIFTHLMMKWAYQRIPQIKMILIFRHPFSVAISKLKLSKGQWMSKPKDFLNQLELYNDYLKPFEQIIKSTKGDFEKHILTWCIVHYIPLKQLSPNEVLLVFYEDLVADTESELKRIFRFIKNMNDINLDPILLSKIKTPSRTSRKDSKITDSQNILEVWKKELSSEQIENALQILKAFGLDQVYNTNLIPNRAAAESMMLNSAL